MINSCLSRTLFFFFWKNQQNSFLYFLIILNIQYDAQWRTIFRKTSKKYIELLFRWLLLILQQLSDLMSSSKNISVTAWRRSSHHRWYVAHRRVNKSAQSSVSFSLSLSYVFSFLNSSRGLQLFFLISIKISALLLDVLSVEKKKTHKKYRELHCREFFI